MTQLAADFGEITDFNALAAKETFSAFMEAKELGFGQIGPALRLLLSGLGGGPDLFEIMAFLGKEECLQRMKNNLGSIATLKATL